MKATRLSFLLLLILSCIQSIVTGGEARRLLYVSNEISGEVGVIDGEKPSIVSTFPVGKCPRGVEVSPDGKYVLVAVSGFPRMRPGSDPERARSLKADKSADGIAILERSTGKRLRILSVGSDPEEFALSSDGSRLYVANEDTAKLSDWHIASGKNLGSHMSPKNPKESRLICVGRRFSLGMKKEEIFMSWIRRPEIGSGVSWRDADLPRSRFRRTARRPLSRWRGPELTSWRVRCDPRNKRTQRATT